MNKTEIATALMEQMAPGDSLHKVLSEVQDECIRLALSKTSGIRSHAAKLLGMKRPALVTRIQKRGAERFPNSPYYRSASLVVGIRVSES